MKKVVEPTLTLAKLYEGQKLHLEAYSIYKYLYTLSGKADLLKKAESNKQKYFSANKLNYKTITKSLFTSKELEKLAIFPHKESKKYSEILGLSEPEYHKSPSDPIDKKDEPTDVKSSFEIDVPLSDFEKMGGGSSNNAENKGDEIDFKESFPTEVLMNNLETLRHYNIVKIIEEALSTSSSQKSIQEFTVEDFLEIVKRGR